MPGLVDTCGVCKEVFSFSLPRCSMCRKTMCSSCVVRVGGCSFCSRECGHSFFYGGASDVEDGEEAPED